MIDKENLIKEANLAFSNGHISNYWHFYTDGKSVEFFFPDDDSFRAGMELTSRLSAEFEVLILAFVLMILIYISFFTATCLSAKDLCTNILKCILCICYTIMT